MIVRRALVMIDNIHHSDSIVDRIVEYNSYRHCQ